MHPIDTSGKRIHRLEDSSHNSRISTEDVHSLCSQLSNLGAHSHLNARASESSHSSIALKNFKEPCILPLKPVSYSSIRIVKSQSVVEFAQFGELPTFRKQGTRSTNNPWRRYGALRKLCETGGFAPTTGAKKERKKREELVVIKQNVKLPPAPLSTQMTLNKVRDPGVYEKRLALRAPKDVGVDVAAQKLAEQVKTFILNHGIELVEDDSVLTAQSK
ncbi:unnamed protein product [Caenorhabditis sp. 36 PRJEB53466]|nr:unnamed protein product [Caenorhabditis sp. 36 PRJEB53466]